MKTAHGSALPVRRPLSLGLAVAGFLLLGACPEEPPPPPECPAGQKGCACDNGGCGTGLVCRDGVCRDAPATVGFTVSDPAARSCEVLVEGTTADDQVTFADTVTGKSVREGAKLAIVFFTNDDAAIAVGAVQIERAGGDLSGVQVARASCFDREGAPLPGTSVTFSR